MFEPKVENEPGEVRSRAIIWVAAAAIVLLGGLVLILVFSKTQSQAVLERVVRAGSPEFEAYKDKLQLEVLDKITHPNMVGMFQLEVRAKMYNRGDRTLSGVEVQGTMIDLADKVLAQGTSVPIPRVRSTPLKPGESLAFSVKVDAPGKVTEDDVKDITIQLHGLQFE
ncbi:MAG TPA: hypothetical protein VJ302_17555 [Blastocatellia bacterium]|nr:hypothetical protein [Blastocatellia bacterium]